MSDQSLPEKKLADEIVELSIRLVQSKYSVEEALISQEWKRKVRLLIKARRDSKVKSPRTQHNL